MEKSAKPKLKWKKWQFGATKGVYVSLGKYDLTIQEKAVDGVKTFQGCVFSYHTNQGELPLPDEHTFGPTTRLSEIKRLLLKELKKIAIEEIQSLAQVFTNDELKKIGLVRKREA